MNLPKHPEQWMDYIRWWVRNNGIEGRVAVLSEGPSMKHGGRNHCMEIVDLNR